MRRNLNVMKKLLTLITLAMLAVIPSQAAVVILKNGMRVEGEILINNADVVIVRDKSGARFQYPAPEVSSVMEDNKTAEAEEVIQEVEEEKKVQGGKKVTFLLNLGGGGAFIPNEANGGYFGGELLIGSRYIGQKSVFLGGGLNVECMFMPNSTYVFLPLQVAVKVPIIEGKHSPYIGANIGYGFGVKNCAGGIYTSAEVGYRYAFNNRSSMYVALRVQFQQATMTALTTVEETTYKDYSGRNFVTFGAQFGISF